MEVSTRSTAPHRLNPPSPRRRLRSPRSTDGPPLHRSRWRSPTSPCHKATPRRPRPRHHAPPHLPHLPPSTPPLYKTGMACLPRLPQAIDDPPCTIPSIPSIPVLISARNTLWEEGYRYSIGPWLVSTPAVTMTPSKEEHLAICCIPVSSANFKSG
ncbi:hypothetical protein BRADI_5g08446v3 [Brachypodium distachyon]|uniref:Uncharacterized protein n=1 Tax=Brachypodium distachyon TaxID=15368 RepID=A0A0Q3E7N5_BRADI|nr:hypothetical protein BRADI_5g08446v3 [Brachypodium distachyon]